MGKKIVCYWGTWSAYREGDGQFTFNHIDPTICTHIVYSFLGATPDGSVKSLDEWLDYQKDGGYIEHFLNLKSKNRNVKLLASIGGWNAGSALFSGIAANSATRSRFAQNVANFCNEHGFDGFDFDWEYPAPHDKGNFTLLLRELRRALGSKILSIATGCSQCTAEQSYNIADVAANVDFVNLMTYDMQSNNGRTGHHAPLYASSDQSIDIDSCVNYWISQGCPKNKIIVGIPTYGKSFTLANTSSNGLNATIAGPGKSGPHTKEAGTLGYNEISVNNWQRRWDSQQQAPHAFNGDQWVGYDDVESVKVKCNYINQRGLGGAIFWSLETDDFLGKSGQGKFPLIKAAYNTLH